MEKIINKKIMSSVKAINIDRTQDKHDWIYGSLWQHDEESYIMADYPVRFDEVDPNTICRLAGKIDMDWIFENDIIQIAAFDLIKPLKFTTGKVVWMEKEMCWGVDINYKYGLPNVIPLCEIIRNYTKCEIKKLGNIYDPKE